jgi:hypothetical protein
MLTSDEIRAVISGSVAGLVIGAALIVAVLTARGTFGQRCEDRGFTWDSPAHRECVEFLMYGRGAR